LHLGDHDEGRIVTRAHEIALVDEPRPEPAINRGTDVGIAEIELGGADLRLIRFDRGLKLRDKSLLLIVALLGLVPGGNELRVSFEVGLSPNELRLVFLFYRERLLEGGLIRPGIDLEERISLLNILALLELDLDNLTIRPALDRHRVVRLNGANP